MHVPLTIGDFLERAALVHGADRVAVVDEPGVAGSLGAITYAEMHDRARGMALALDAMGVAHGERVAIVSPNSARFLISFFGVSGFGRVLVPVNFRLNADEVAYIVEHSGASVLLVDPELEEPLAGVSAKVRMVLDGERGRRAVRARRRPGPPRRAGRATRAPRARSTTPRARRRAPRGCSSPTGTAGSTPRSSDGTPP